MQCNTKRRHPIRRRGERNGEGESKRRGGTEWETGMWRGRERQGREREKERGDPVAKVL